jgi:UDP-GlcNAc:undecaprenyl-phosphate/decaprenyl-phosphate GlcNAc-1-phosphate transferase
VTGAYAFVFAVAAVATWACTFAVRRIAVRIGAVVMPDERKVHAVPTPVGGGAAMFVAFLVAMLAASQMGQFKEIFESSSAPLGIVVGATIIFAVGMADDLRDMSAPAKMAGQVLAGSTLALLGVTMFFLQIPFAGFVALSPDLAPLATVLWVAVMANALNLIDGLDGLAAGIVALAAGSFFLYGDNLMRDGNIAPDNVGPLIAAIACGVCIGFLPHNFHPARIFMGDAGSMLLGLLMAGSTLVVVGQTDNEFSGKTFFFFAPIFIPFFILGVPIVDTIFAIVRRAGRRGVSEADKEHLHHRLVRLGHGHRRSVLILWAWTAVLCVLVLYPTFTNQGNAVIPVLVAALGIALYTLFHPGIRQRPVLGEDEGADIIELDPRKSAG